MFIVSNPENGGQSRGSGRQLVHRATEAILPQITGDDLDLTSNSLPHTQTDVTPVDQEDLFHQFSFCSFDLLSNSLPHTFTNVTPVGQEIYTTRRLLGFHFADKRRLFITLNSCQAHNIRSKVTLANQAYKSQSQITEMFPSEGNRNP